MKATGCLGPLLVFYVKTMLPLRGVAIVSNIVFMAYELAGGVYPVFAARSPRALLPLNCLRLHQMRRLIRKVRGASRGDVTEWPIPPMTRRTLPKGDALFRTGAVGNSDLAFGFYLFRLVVPAGARARAPLARIRQRGALLSLDEMSLDPGPGSI